MWMCTSYLYIYIYIIYRIYDRLISLLSLFLLLLVRIQAFALAHIQNTRTHSGIVIQSSTTTSTPPPTTAYGYKNVLVFPFMLCTVRCAYAEVSSKVFLISIQRENTTKFEIFWKFQHCSSQRVISRNDA